MTKYLIISIFVLLLPLTLPASEKKENKFSVITLDDRARLCKKAGCPSNKAIVRLPTNTILTSTESMIFKSGFIKSRWYKVDYNKMRGWTSEFDLKAVK